MAATTILGSHSYTDTPDVNGIPVLLNAGTVPSVQSGLYASIPSAGTVGRLYVATDTNVIYRDNGTAWVPLESTNSTASFYSGSIPLTSGTTLIPADTSTPASTEGTQIMSQVVTPVSTASKIILRFEGIVDSSAARYITVAAFRGTTCIQVASLYLATSGRIQSLSLQAIDMPATTAATTYSLRIGASTAATWYVGGSTSYTFGGVAAAKWTIEEKR